ncbi:MAG TPA: glycosyltransferase [Caulobacteraceae bacterium]|nr:glycosyltransferase [Caulobacteraceae bacterium]
MAGGWDFTCLLPVWAGDDAEHFRAAVAAVASASLPPNAILICQDGELPHPLAAAVAEARNDLGVRLVSNPGSRGLHHNLNHAMTQIRTPWVCRADADDIDMPDRFQAQIGFLRSHPEVSVLGCAIIEFWPDGRSRQKPMPLKHEAIVRFARWRNPINHMTAFFRTDAFLDCGGYPDIPMKEDYGLWLAMIARDRRLANLAEPLVRARLGADFHRRRSGLRNLASEWALFQIKRATPGIGAGPAAAAFLARSAALTLNTPAAVIYEGLLRA